MNKGENQLKICKQCCIEKNINEYTHYSGKLCKECYRQNTSERVKRNREKNKKEKVLTDTKICKQCKIEKDIIHYKNRNVCIDCFNLNRKERYIKDKNNTQNNKIENNKIENKKWKDSNKEKVKEYNRKYYEKNIEKIKESNKKWKYNNIDKVKISNKSWRNNNKEKIKELNKKRNSLEQKEKRNIYLGKNKIKIREKARKRLSERRSTNILFKLSNNIRSLINFSFRNMGYKKGTKTESILGCSVEDFKIYLESKFEPWMTWENHGKYNSEFNFGWDIDHIEPLFPEGIIRTEEDILRLNHYSNLQPLCSYINRNIKVNKLEFESFTI